MTIYSRRHTRGLPFFQHMSRARLAFYAIMGVFVLVLLGTVFTFSLFAIYSRDLPQPDKVRRTEGFSTIIYDRNGEALYDIYGDQNRVPAELQEIPKKLQQATIAVEDKDFYKHQGFSEAGILRGLIRTIFFGNTEGGSTLTQQLVKNVLLSNERTLPRKIKEFILAVQIERKYSKDEILQMYLNEAGYGGATAGVEKAAEYYFDKHVKELTLIECVVLAGLPQSPNRYSPYNTQDPKAYVWRSEQVARRMREDGYITKVEEDQIKQQLPSLQFTRRVNDIKAPHFVMDVRKQLIEKFGEQTVEKGGLRVTTTLDWKIQEQAEKIVAEEIAKLKGMQVGNGAAVVLNPSTGEILAMVGSSDYFASESGTFNVVTQAQRQPGSTMKPITYATAFKKGYTPATLVFDAETFFPGGVGQKEYSPKNYDGKYRGPMQLRYALANSINTVAVKLQAMVGLKDMLSVANDMGLRTLPPTDETINRVGLSVVLGGGDVYMIDLVNAYGVFANQGMYHPAFGIAKVTDSKGNLIWENKPASGRQVLSPEVAYLVSSVLSDNDARKDVFGSRSYLFIPGKTVAAKTGTTDDYRDNWTIGYTPSFVVGAWVGNSDNTPMSRKLVSGTTGAAPIWNRIMQTVLKDKKDEPFIKPDNVVQLDIDAAYGGLPHNGQPTRKEYFIKGTEPQEESPVYKKYKVSKQDGNKLANPVQVAVGDYDEKEFLTFTENDPLSGDGKNRWQDGINAWIAKQGDAKYKPPTDVSSDRGGQVVVSIRKPGDKEKIDSNDVIIEVLASSTERVKKIELRIDGEVRATIEDDRLSQTFNLPDGPHTIQAYAESEKGNRSDSEIKIGVKTPWDQGLPSSSPTPTNKP